MEEWKSYKLSDVAFLSTGFPFDGHKYAKEGIRVVRGDNVTIGSLRWDSDKDKRWSEPFSRADEYTLQDGDIVIGMDGSRVGKNRAQVNVTDLPLLLAQRVACIRHNEKSCQEFLFYQIFSERFVEYIKSVQTGTSIPHVSLKQIGDFPIQMPPIEEQVRIAKILRSLDNKIALNLRINHNLEQQAQALYKSWFVDFEPFKDEEFVDSELGMIPEGWRVGTLGELLEIRYGKDHKKLSDGPYPVYGSGGLMRKVERPLFEGESVLIPRKGSLNNVMYVNEAFWSVDTMFFSVERMPNVVKYSYQILSQLDLASMNSGSAVPSMTTDILNAIQVVIPDKKVLENYNIILSRFFSSVASIRNESCRLVDIRNSILPKLMNGEILC